MSKYSVKAGIDVRQLPFVDKLGKFTHFLARPNPVPTHYTKFLVKDLKLYMYY